MRIFLSIIFCFLFLPFFAEAQSIDDSISSIYRDIYCSDIDVYMKVEKMPAYPGGMRELIKDIEENLVYPEDAKKKWHTRGGRGSFCCR